MDATTDEDHDAAFETALDRLDVASVRTDAAGFEATLRDHTVDPAVGMSLPFEGVSLPDDVPTAPTPDDLRTARTGITPALLAIADYGSVVLEATPEGTEPTSLFPERHTVVLRAADLVPDMPAAFERLGPRIRESRTSEVIATGPSATADMGELVRGAHGPEEVHVVIVEGVERSDGAADADAAGSAVGGADGNGSGGADASSTGAER